MSFGVCELSLIPVRKESNHRSEMVSQLLFGETYTVIENNEEWCLIRITNDNYEGWIEFKQHAPISEQEFKHLGSNPYFISTDLVQVINNISKNTIFPILLGSNIYAEPNKAYFLNKQEYIYNGEMASSSDNPKKSTIIENALMYHHTPYLWGGKSPFGIDCSGFTQMAYYLSGIKLLRDASQQATQGETINMISEAAAADLCFFDNDEGEITHVGILLPDHKIIHASGQVRIDLIDHQGIYNSITQSYSHKLRLIKRLI
jgi:gamma-D-glutamyl-L-lysine dipeptidyl-peptidase